MDGGYSDSPPTVSDVGASKFLAGLPSRGFFSSPSSNPGQMRLYICDHDTSPPADQIIRTNEQNILIRTLVLKKQNGDSASKDWIGSSSDQVSRKRKALDGKAAQKKATPSTQLASSQVGSSLAHDRDLMRLRKVGLQALLMEKGLSTSGTKAQLIARLNGVNS